MGTGVVTGEGSAASFTQGEGFFLGLAPRNEAEAPGQVQKRCLSLSAMQTHAHPRPTGAACEQDPRELCVHCSQRSTAHRR